MSGDRLVTLTGMDAPPTEHVPVSAPPRETWIQEPAIAPYVLTKPRRRWPIAALALAVAFLNGVLIGGLGVALLGWHLDGFTPDPSGRPQASDAIPFCREQVRLRLKAPATAQFSAETATYSVPGDTGSVVLVTGQVDSQNGFGALLRSRYECRAAPFSDGSWTLARAVELNEW